jgi:predicted phosphodiesterase
LRAVTPRSAILPARIGVIGDVHAEDERLERALEHFRKVEATVVFCVGDVTDGYGSATRSAELLADHGVLTVRGNHERWTLSNTMRDLPAATDPATLSPRARTFLETRPVTLELSSPLGPLLVCHGMGSNDMVKVKPDDFGVALTSNLELQQLLRERRFRLVVNGHSHRPMVRRFETLTIVNAGTLKRDENPCVVVIDFAKKLVDFVPFDAEGALDPARTQSIELDVPPL